MKPINILKKLITLYYYLILGVLIFGVISIPILIFVHPETDLKLFNRQISFESLPAYKSLFVVVIIGVLYFVFFKAIQLLKISLEDLSKGHYFSELVIKNFNRIGKLFLICGIGEFFGHIIFGLLLNSEFNVEIDSSLVLFIVMSLMFMFLSEVFEVAKKAKQENNLTI